MSESGFIEFTCPHCQTAIEASPDMVGTEAECPACGVQFFVPDPSARDGEPARGDSDEESNRRATKNRTIRIELGEL